MGWFIQERKIIKMVSKKLDWMKRNVNKTAKLQTTPISLSIDQEINFHLGDLRLSPTELFREFVCLKSGKKLYDIERHLSDELLKLINLNRGSISKNFRHFCIQKIIEKTDKESIKKRMEEKISEEKLNAE